MQKIWSIWQLPGEREFRSWYNQQIRSFGSGAGTDGPTCHQLNLHINHPSEQVVLCITTYRSTRIAAYRHSTVRRGIYCMLHSTFLRISYPSATYFVLSSILLSALVALYLDIHGPFAIFLSHTPYMLPSVQCRSIQTDIANQVKV